MALYHEAASILDKTNQGNVSIKSLVYGKEKWKSDQKTLFALSTEAAKWSEILAEVVDKSGLLKVEKQLKPLLALVLAHDLLLAKRGVALPATHGLHSSIARYKARLSAELTKVRIRKGFSTLDVFRMHVKNNAVGDELANKSSSKGSPLPLHPRWVRINTLKTTMQDQIITTFADCAVKNCFENLFGPDGDTYMIDEDIQSLIAVHPSFDITSTKAYKRGELILQDKASCFPAMLMDPSNRPDDGDYLDACAAPGNKTTQLAALLRCPSSKGVKIGKVIACEKDPTRSMTLEKMVALAGGESCIKVKAKQDFMKLDPNAKEFANVTGILLDPSCSGSGIIGRDEGGVTVHSPSMNTDLPVSKGKKRKRGPEKVVSTPAAVEVVEEQPDIADDADEKLLTRLTNLSGFQLRLVQRAMAFPAAKRITYSTCSVYPQENEHVVVKALQSDIAVQRGWRIMKRDKQSPALGRWPRRGVREECEGSENAEEVAEGCIRCAKGTEEGTMGFFVAGFVRDEDHVGANTDGKRNGVQHDQETDDQGVEEWNGISDDD